MPDPRLRGIYQIALLALILSSFILLHPALADDGQRSYIAAHSAPAEPAGYGVGTINGVNVHIPQQYLLHHIVYAGEHRDGSGPASAATTNDSSIDNFSILVRLSDLQPLTTEADRQDWRDALSKPLFSRTWMMVSFDNHYSIPPASDTTPRMVSIWGPYIRDETSRYGLQHFASVQSVDDGARGLYGHVEYFFQADSRTTIMCQTRRKKVAPFDTFSICEHHFLVPELHVMAEAVYTEPDVARWHRIEQRIREIAHSFVVQ